jgi:hypoxanthine-DNA glycosylase
VNNNSSFAPIIFDGATTLILGTYPSIKSFEHNFYYSHPRNQFWPLLEAVYQRPIVTEDEKLTLLKMEKIALWDVCFTAARKEGNSSDTNLDNIVPNDIKRILKENPTITHVMFTGKKAEQLFNKFFKQVDIQTVVLPSPSSAYAAMKFEQKLEVYQELLYK